MPEYLITQGYQSTGVGKIYHKGSSAEGHDGKSWSIPHKLPKNFDPAYGKAALNNYQDPYTKKEVKKLLTEAKAINYKFVKIKLVEVYKLLTELKKTDKVNTDNLVDLLQYYELIKEIKLTK